MSQAKYTGKELTKFLRSLAMELESIKDDGEVITKAEALARVLWKRALGGEDIVTRAGVKVSEYKPPEAWAIQLIYERLEGKVANASVEETTRLTAAERVSDLARERINKMSGVPVTVGKATPPKIGKKDK